MSHCKICFATNPDSATICGVCKAPLEKAEAGGGRKPTMPEATISQAHRHTEVEGLGFSGPTVPGNARQAAPNPPSGGAPGRRVTIFDPGKSATPEAAAKPAAAAVPSAAGARKIVGVLVTYSWNDQGQIFPVYEGRNRIGSDPAQCDISVPQDDTLSSINSHIVYRKSFTIGDDVSMGGTDVDGEPVETAFVPLRNYARIRAGSTHFTFISVQQPASEGGASPAESK